MFKLLYSLYGSRNRLSPNTIILNALEQSLKILLKDKQITNKEQKAIRICIKICNKIKTQKQEAGLIKNIEQSLVIDRQHIKNFTRNLRWLFEIIQKYILINNIQNEHYR